MKVVNIHERQLAAPPDRVGALLDSLASPRDLLWPRLSWPPLEFDRPLHVGARGGHGPIRYVVEDHAPGSLVKFRFTGPSGFDGVHAYRCMPGEPGTTLLRHTLEMTVRGVARLSWPLIFRPLHDALIEDSLTTAEAVLGLPIRVQPWSYRVRSLRWAFSCGRASPQRITRQRAFSSQ